MLPSNLVTTSQIIRERRWKEAYQAIRWTFFNILEELSAIATDGSPLFSPSNHLSSLFTKYKVITFNDYPQWNMLGWILLTQQEYPDLLKFARLSTEDFPIKDINLVFQQEYLCQEDIKRNIHENLSNIIINSSISSTIEDQLIWDQFIEENNGCENLQKASEGLVFLNKMVEEYKAEKRERKNN